MWCLEHTFSSVIVRCVSISALTCIMWCLEHTGQHDTQAFEGGEADLHQLISLCSKNPGHHKFTPIERFRVHDLPEGHRDPELYHLIKAVADITLRVDVKMTSEKRPKFWPGRTAPYPFSSPGFRKVLRLGTGEVDKVIKFSEGFGLDHKGARHESRTTTCPCDKCVSSEHPSKEWWEIYIDTASHVVFDEYEASHTTCRLFYDSEHSPLFTLDKVGVYHVNTEGDWCVLIHETCDAEVAGEVSRKFSNWVSLRDRVYERYDGSADRLAFIVSHPHGCPKQVSFGQWRDNRKLGEYKDYILSHLTYTTCTCPGSSGATVHCVGCFWDHLHSGTLDSGLNYSGVGAVLRI